MISAKLIVFSQSPDQAYYIDNEIPVATEVHLELFILTKYAVSKVVGSIKVRVAIQLFKHIQKIRKKH